MRLFLSTGEVSGDLQGGLLVAALYRRAAALGLDLEVVALGGDRIAAAGAQVLADTTGLGAIGLVEPLRYVRATQRLQRQTKAFLSENPPDLAVLVDYMGGNLPLGRYLRKRYPTLPIFYYIAPQEWVWSLGEGNTRRLIGFADEILAIFPQEAKYFEARGARVRWVGHPLLDRLADGPTRAEARQRLELGVDQVAIALFPASRTQELTYLMPPMFAAAQRLQAQRPEVCFLIPAAMERYRGAIAQAVQDYGLRAQVLEDSPVAIAAADLAIAKSGTVNLELALQNVPQVVIYRVSEVTAWVAKYLLRFSLPFMSPPNLVNFEAVVPELLQYEVTPERIVAEALTLLEDPGRQRMLAGYARMRQSLGEPGVCDRAAAIILEWPCQKSLAAPLS